MIEEDEKIINGTEAMEMKNGQVDFRIFSTPVFMGKD